MIGPKRVIWIEPDKTAFLKLKRRGRFIENLKVFIFKLVFLIKLE
jgi:hypothetical protein